MKFIKAIFVSLCLTFSATSAFAGSGHAHGPIDQYAAQAKAERTVSNMVKRKVLDNSWQGLPMASIERTKRRGDLIWLARFDNEQVADRSKRKLFVYLTLTGGFITANYTGE